MKKIAMLLLMALFLTACSATEDETEKRTEGAAVTEGETESESRTDVDTEEKTESDPLIESASEYESVVEGSAERESESMTADETETNNDIDVDFDDLFGGGETQTELSTEAETEAETEATTEAETEAETATETEMNQDIETDFDGPFGEGETQTKPATETESESESETVELVYEIFEAKTLSASNGVDLPYRIYVPADYSAEKSYPLVLFLHGAGERGDDNSLQLKNVVKTLFADDDSPVHDSIFILPQCATGAQWVDTPWANGSYSLDDVFASAHHEALLELLAFVRNSYSVDADRLYVMGISMGGFGTWDMIMRHPDTFAAAIPVCGGADPSKASLIAHIPLRTFHGDMDAAVPISATREMAAALEAANAVDFIYEELSGYGHNVWDYMAEKEGLMDWLFSQRRNLGE